MNFLNKEIKCYKNWGSLKFLNTMLFLPENDIRLIPLLMQQTLCMHHPKVLYQYQSLESMTLLRTWFQTMIRIAKLKWIFSLSKFMLTIYIKKSLTRFWFGVATSVANFNTNEAYFFSCFCSCKQVIRSVFKGFRAFS